MKRLGGISIEDELNGFDVNRLDNVLTMDSNFHNFFDKLKIWFEETVSKGMLVLHTNKFYRWYRINTMSEQSTMTTFSRSFNQSHSLLLTPRNSLSLHLVIYVSMHVQLK